MKALKRSTMIDPETKAKVEPLLVGECMSSEESAVQESGDERERESSNSEQEDEVRQSSRKKLIKHKLTWRSVEFQKIIESLKSLRVSIEKLTEDEVRIVKECV